MKIQFGKPLINSKEINSVKRILSGSILVHGPKTQEFEKNFFHILLDLNIQFHCRLVLLASHLGCLAMGLKKGDEVIVSSQTHVATAHAIEITGAKPIFIDSLLPNGNIDCNQIEKK